MPDVTVAKAWPHPRSGNRLHGVKKLAGGRARLNGGDTRALTARVSVTVSAALPIRLKVGALPVCCQTWASTGPADSPGKFGVLHLAGVGKGTVSEVLPVRAVARACASSVVPRMKFTIGRPKPRFGKPLPVIVFF